MIAIELLADILASAFATLRKLPPRDLRKAMEFPAYARGAELPDDVVARLVDHVKTSGANDRILHEWTIALQSWDHEEGDWASGTKAYSVERRKLVLDRLNIAPQDQLTLNERIHRYSAAELPIVIAESHASWYPERRLSIKDFYWSHYVRQLLPPRGNWSSKSVGMLDVSIDDVIGRISDPCRSEIYPVKGLVVGYVQSGKTSHFSGLITKAADAGYRLIIVLAGTLDILRKQTQRRIDKEIVGRELLGSEEYGGDADWESFVSHDGRPSHNGSFDWERLTDSGDDYKTLKRHLSVLEFVSADRSKPYNHPDNLRVATAKVAVIKKVPARLNQLCKDLESLRELRNRLEHVPTLVIDDESDQASINTVDQSKPNRKGDRTKTNKAIVRLLALLPRAQYVGYTATPFANVFIDPEDAEDLFPKDFIVSLPRPDGYMGVSDFFDFETEFPQGDYRGNENAFVRSVEGENEDANNLPKAIDSFILAGAIKLYRSDKEPEKYSFRHHTMLIHHSAATMVHEADRVMVDELFGNGARYQRRAGLEALRELFDSDFRQVSKVRAAAEPMPKSFEELRPYVSLCLSRVCAGKPVRVVNGEGRNRDDTPDFEQNEVWAILLGGSKLSRGYTVEGLTVSYYRRPAGAGDTLMQMGRWFGFRNGYRDLVRLFIGRREKKGRTFVDLYEAFGAVCRDEEALRADLTKYSHDGLKPRQVPPLVRQHLASLPPTSKNKRFNAEIRSLDFAGESTEKTSAPTSSSMIRHNQAALETLLGVAKLGAKESVSFLSAGGEKRSFDAVFATAKGKDVLTFLKAYKWAGGRQSVELEIAYVAGALDKRELGEWVIMLPQARTGRTMQLRLKPQRNLAVISRARVSESRFGAYSEPRHREAAAAIAGVATLTEANSELVKRLNSPRPVMILYLVEEKGASDSPVSVGFAVQYPGVRKDRAITWQVRDRSNVKSVVVKS
jgi:hypothetical protein